MPRGKKFKFVGPFLRKLRVKNGVERNWLAKKMSRTTADMMNIELGNRAVPNLRTLKSWLHYLGAEDKYDTAVKLYLADGDTLEIDIRALSLEERLRLVAIMSAFKTRKVHPRLIELIDEALFSEPVVIQKGKPPGHTPKIGELPVMTEFTYNHRSGNVELTQEYNRNEWVKEQEQRETRGEGGIQRPGSNPGDEVA